LTRPAERAAPLREKLSTLGHDVSLAPLLAITNLEVDIPDMPLQGVIFTSVQGVQAVAAKESLKIFPAFTVGNKTAGAAVAAGYVQVHNADGDVEDLLGLIQTHCKPGKGLLLHLAGENTVGRLTARLAEAGFEAKSKTVYRAQAAQSLPSSIVERFVKRQIDAVLFFSTRTAAIFGALALEKGLEDSLQKMDAFCLSEAIAEEVRKIPWRKVHAAPEPTEQALIDLLQVRGK